MYRKRSRSDPSADGDTKAKGKRYYKSKAVARIPRTVAPSSVGVSFKRTWFDSAWPFSTVTTAGYYRVFRPSFADIPNSGEYVSLFDNFSITGIKITFHPRVSDVTVGATTTTAITSNQMYITMATDPETDPVIIPTGLYSNTTYNYFLERQAHPKTFKLDRPRSMFFRPKIAKDDNNGREMRTPGWLSLQTSQNEPHSSLWAFIHDYNFSNTPPNGFGVDIQYTFYFKCKGSH